MSVRARAALGGVALGALLGGCALAGPGPGVAERWWDGPTASHVAGAHVPALRCDLDSLRWSRGFVPRADARDCVVVLEVVRPAH